MSKIHLIDTNVLLRHILNDHPDLSQKAKAFMDKVKDGEITAKIIEGVLVECVYVLLKVYKVPRGEIASVLIDILEYIGITKENKSVYITGLKNFANNRVDIVDNFLAAFADDDMVIVSYDEDFAGLNVETYRLS